MSVMRIRKVTVLPSSYEPSTVYLVTTTNPLFFKLYVSSSDGSSVRRLPDMDDIQSWIASAMGGYYTALIVANIAARDALTLTTNTQVLVLDATGDTSVASGAATYVYDVASHTWIKISEANNLEVIQQWNNIVGRPSSTPADIDEAVSQTHTHANKAIIDLLGDVSGSLSYKGEPIRAYIDEESW